MTSPGSSVDERRNVGDLLAHGEDHVGGTVALHLAAVEPADHLPRLAGAASSGVTIHGPNAPLRSKFLPGVAWRECVCQSRTEFSAKHA
jgi:hypothetical protein